METICYFSIPDLLQNPSVFLGHTTSRKVCPVHDPYCIFRVYVQAARPAGNKKPCSFAAYKVTKMLVFSCLQNYNISIGQKRKVNTFLCRSS